MELGREIAQNWMLLKISWKKNKWIAGRPRPLETNRTQEQHQGQEGSIWTVTLIFQLRVMLKSQRSQACSPSCQSWEWCDVHVHLYFVTCGTKPITFCQCSMGNRFRARPPNGCLQWHTELDGRVSTFNFLATANDNHLANQQWGEKQLISLHCLRWI